MAGHTPAVTRAIGVGASAGGLDALIRLVRGIPADIEAPVLIVLHLAPSRRSMLPAILGRHTDLPVRPAEEGEPLVAGTILVAPADRHLLVADGRVRLERGPRENGSRPAVDPMFRALAAEFPGRAVAVVLSGALADGASGARFLAASGGHVLVQDPRDATVPSMPERTLAAVPAASVLRADEMGPALATLVRGLAPEDDRGVPAADSPMAPSRSPGAGDRVADTVDVDPERAA